MDDDDGVLARFAAATPFLLMAGLALLVAWFGATDESGSSWSEPEVRMWTVFCAANVVGAGLAGGLRWGSWPARFAGFLLIVPAFVLLASLPSNLDYDATSGWTMTAGAVALLLVGGMVAGGMAAKVAGLRG
jgi:hypothetical protein